MGKEPWLEQKDILEGTGVEGRWGLKLGVRSKVIKCWKEGGFGSLGVKGLRSRAEFGWG